MADPCDVCGSGTPVVHYATRAIRLRTRAPANDTNAPRSTKDLIVTAGQHACVDCRVVLDAAQWPDFRTRMVNAYEQRNRTAASSIEGQRDRSKLEVSWKTLYEAIQAARARGDVTDLTGPPN